MSPFELAQPRTMREALALLAEEGAHPLSGGTALMLMLKAGVLRPRRLVSLRHLGLAEFAMEPDGSLRLGAMTPLADLERYLNAQRAWPVLTRTLRRLSNVRVRNVATVGGALAHADPHMDLPPLLTALGAQAVIAGMSGERTVPVGNLYAGYLENTLRKGEIITRVEVPALGKRRAAYLKCTTRSADDWPAVGVAAVLDSDEATLAVSAATDRPTRLAKAEQMLKGRLHDDNVLAQAAEAAAEEVAIEGDLHGSAPYKRQLLRVYLKRTLHEARNAIH